MSFDPQNPIPTILCQNKHLCMGCIHFSEHGQPCFEELKSCYKIGFDILEDFEKQIKTLEEEKDGVEYDLSQAQSDARHYEGLVESLQNQVADLEIKIKSLTARA